jgi:DNA-binding response OmpR family regulator
MKILIVEDDLMQRRFLQVMLTQSGREVIAAASKSALNSFWRGLRPVRMII